jgi:WD40 repeat protein
VTGSMDKSIKLWDVEKGICLSTLYGHTAEIVNVKFN